MKLKKLIKDIPRAVVKGSKELDITGVCANSKLVAPGNLFVARKGRAEDGMLFIPEAVAAGAAAILTDIYDPLLAKRVTQIIHHDIAALEGLVAAEYYQYPSDQMFMVGITGTNGKTTTSFLVRHLLNALDGSCGLIGTIEYIIGQHRYQATRTTPDAASNHKMLREMVLQGCKNGVMEVTSHALDQNRVDYINFDTAVFTNLTLDHLDYHQTMEKYCEAKSKLFSFLNPDKKKNCHPHPKLAIVNADSSWHQEITSGCRATLLTYGIENEADLKAEDLRLTPEGSSMVVNYKGTKTTVKCPMVGRFNTYNCLAAIGVALSKGLPLEKIVKALETAPPVPGRLEPVPNPLGLKIYVDFAHSDDALKNVLDTLCEFKKGRIITVFGCGGNRDASKRPKMAEVCVGRSEEIVITSDNPRGEDPEEILRQIAKGFAPGTRYHKEADRYLAIEKAISLAQPDDIVLIAGKGHETQQIFAHKIVDFDDRKVALEICRKKAANALRQ